MSPEHEESETICHHLDGKNRSQETEFCPHFFEFRSNKSFKFGKHSKFEFFSEKDQIFIQFEMKREK